MNMLIELALHPVMLLLTSAVKNTTVPISRGRAIEGVCSTLIIMQPHLSFKTNDSSEYSLKTVQSFLFKNA